MKSRRFVLSSMASAIAFVCSFAVADEGGAAAGAMRVMHPWARPTVTGQTAGGVFLTIDNHGPADRLIGVAGDVAAQVQLHQMAMEGNVMRMREVTSLDVPSGGQVALEPGALHIMLIGLKAPLAAGTRFPLRLRFEKAGEIEVDVPVEAAGSR